ncbi:MAG TPA: helix-turn-helix transcriptional regulator [Naasia sp.]|jgi:DNA-binding CsgD family transcriptional regulator
MTTAPSDARTTRLVGSESEGTAASLLGRIDASPSRRIVTGVTGPGRTGKTLLLDAAAARWEAKGVPVLRHSAGSAAESADHPPGWRSGLSAAGAVIVDDAHLLPDGDLHSLRDIAAGGGPSLLVAYRARADRPALRSLAAAVERHGVPTVLGPLDREGLASAAGRNGAAASPAFLDGLAEATGGLPWLVHRVLAANPRRGVSPVVPWQVVDRLGYELAELPPGQQELLLTLSLGFDAGATAVLTGSPSEVDGLLDEARDAGLLLPDGRVVPLLRDAVGRTTPLHRVRAVQRSLVDTLAQSGRALERVGRTLARSGLQDPRVAGCLASAADHVLESHPETAAGLYADALAAGAGEEELAARVAQARWASGEPDAAWAALAPVLPTADPEHARRATDVAGALWAARGMLTGAADAYRWRGPDMVGESAPLAALAMYGIGDRAAAEEMLAATAPRGGPTLATMAMRMMAEGVRDSLGAAAPRALPSLVRASDLFTSSGLTLPMPVAPAVLAAVLAVGAGELRTAEAVLDAALAGGQGGRVARPALLLHRAWAAMQADRPDIARTAAESAQEGGALGPRDQMLRLALDVAIARRTDDAAGLLRAWRTAREEVLHVSVDLFSLLPVAELAVAGARLRDSAHVDYQTDAGFALLARLGDPPLWAAPLHWAAVQAGILSKQPAQLGPHMAALTAGAATSRLSAVLAGAGRAWVSVLSGSFEVAAIEAAARSLASVGLPWDGSRLAGHAAAHAEERKDMSRLLACARGLHGATGGATQDPSGPATGPVTRPAAASGASEQRSGGAGQRQVGTREPAAATRGSVPAGDSRGDSLLSPRERDVARLVLEGKNYKEIGEVIFISPRTVEHHIARIRQRLSARSRSDLLTQLRIALDEGADDPAPTPSAP